VTTPDINTPAAGRAHSLRRGRRHPGERVIESLLVLAALVSVATTVGIIAALAQPTIRFFSEVSVVEFFTSGRWTPTFSDKHYGVLPLVVATVMSTLIAVAVAVPLGLGAAIYLAEYASDRVRGFAKPILEVLAGIPTVVYGFFALFALNPILQRIWPGEEKPSFQNLLVAGVVIGIMIIPTVASLSEDAMTAVPNSLREGAYALASSKMQVAVRVVLPAAISGIIASFVLGVSRALGETMVVTIAGGLSSDGIEWNPTKAAATMTAYIANIASGDIPVDSIDYTTVFAVGSLLFIMTFALNALSIRLVRRFREVYE
jgi:phosphate transport system permease protein